MTRAVVLSISYLVLSSLFVFGNVFVKTDVNINKLYLHLKPCSGSAVRDEELILTLPRPERPKGLHVKLEIREVQEKIAKKEGNEDIFVECFGHPLFCLIFFRPFKLIISLRR